jgi:hypothetical protein
MADEANTPDAPGDALKKARSEHTYILFILLSEATTGGRIYKTLPRIGEEFTATRPNKRKEKFLL